jgi:hypothetical protein
MFYARDFGLPKARGIPTRKQPLLEHINSDFHEGLV